MPVERQSPCKVNLILNILGRRPDGFHELETVMQPVPVRDTLTFESGGEGVQLTCSIPGLPVDSGNLVYRAAEKFFAAAAIQPAVRIHLEKRIPLAAGLGGGSSNAAITLLGLNELHGSPIKAAELLRIAAELGSDVPFFLQQQPALATGRGENVMPLHNFPALKDAQIVLIHPGFGVSTPWAYKNLVHFPKALNGAPGRAARLVDALQQPRLDAAIPDFYNSLEAPVLRKYPILAMFQEFLREQGAAVAMMSGSGSTTFGIFTAPFSFDRLRDAFESRFGATSWLISAPLP